MIVTLQHFSRALLTPDLSLATLAAGLAILLFSIFFPSLFQ